MISRIDWCYQVITVTIDTKAIILIENRKPIETKQSTILLSMIKGWTETKYSNSLKKNRDCVNFHGHALKLFMCVLNPFLSFSQHLATLLFSRWLFVLWKKKRMQWHEKSTNEIENSHTMGCRKKQKNDHVNIVFINQFGRIAFALEHYRSFSFFIIGDQVGIRISC